MAHTPHCPFPARTWGSQWRKEKDHWKMPKASLGDLGSACGGKNCPWSGSTLSLSTRSLPFRQSQRNIQSGEWGGGLSSDPASLSRAVTEYILWRYLRAQAQGEMKGSKSQKLHNSLFYTPDICATNNLGRKQVHCLKIIEDHSTNSSGLHCGAKTLDRHSESGVF